MRALIRTSSGVAVAQQPDPTPQPDEVVVAVHSCGICGSDVHAAQRHAGRATGIPGHEFAGTIADVGRAVEGWHIGQPVAVNPLCGCGECPACARDLLIMCRNRPNLGLNAPGGMAEYVAVPQSQLFAMPDGRDLELGSRMEPLSVALRAIAEAQPAPGDNALVYGVGPIGLCVILGLRASGAGTIVAVGRSSAGRRAAAAAVGADVVLDSRETSPAAYLAEHGIPVMQAYDCSGDPQALVACTEAVQPGGTIVELALGWEPAAINTHQFVVKNLRLLSGTAFGQRDYQRAHALITSGAVDVRPLISQRIPLEDGPAAFERLQHPGDLVSVLIQPWRQPGSPGTEPS